MLCKLKILAALIFITTVVSGQTKTSEVLKLKNEQYYSERNILSAGKTPKLIQEVCYDKPYSLDEEYCIILTLTILDSS